MIFHSKMNCPTTWSSGTYRMARKYLDKLMVNTWHNFDDIPEDIKLKVINLLDSGYPKRKTRGGYIREVKIEFDEFFERFILYA